MSLPGHVSDASAEPGPRNRPSRAKAPLEPLIPGKSAWFYILLPPFLLALITPRLFQQTPLDLINGIAIVWVHAAIIGLPLHVAYMWLLPGWIAASRSKLRRFFIHFTTVATIAVSGTELADRLCAVIWGLPFPKPIHWWQYYVSLLVTSIFVMVQITYARLRRQAREVELRAQETRQAALAAELRSLQSRINPHFLFNSLNTVAGLIGEDRQRAECTVEGIAAIFRYTLDASAREYVHLHEEIDAVKRYLEVEELRFGDRLRWDIQVQENLLSAHIPPLVIQPLVENAVRHGMSQQRGSAIDVEIMTIPGFLRIAIADDGPGPGNSLASGTRTSVRDLRERLRLLYDRSDLLNLERRPEGGCLVELRLPHEEH